MHRSPRHGSAAIDDRPEGCLSGPMVTHFLSEKDVRSYMADLRQRLESMAEMPEIFCLLTNSGTCLLRHLLPGTEDNKSLDGILAMGIGIEKTEGTTTVRMAPEDEALIPGKRVMLMDGAIHSGKTMADCHRHLTKLGAAAVCSYSLVVKRSTCYVPTFFGLMIGDPDRAYFLLDTIPNNRLDAGASRSPYVHLELLEESDVERPQLVSDLGSMDRITWGDRYYDIQNSTNRQTYLLKERDTVVGFLTLHTERKGMLTIEEVAVDREHKSKGYGGILLRFADTMARHSSCRSIRLNAITNKVELYRKFGYAEMAKKPLKLGSDEAFQPMTRPILYHIPPEEA